MQRKAEAVQRPPCGADLNTLSRSLRVTVATLRAWQDDILRGGASALRTQEAATDHDSEVQRLQAKIGEQTMGIELLYKRHNALEKDRPLPPGRSKP